MYQVGQFLYVTNQKKLSVIPVQIIQEVTIKDLSGEKTEYIIQFPDKNKTTAQISELRKEIFESIEAVKDHMISKATKAINEMCDHALSMQKNNFESSTPEKLKSELEVNQSESNVQADIKDDIIMVDLGNGVKAKMNTTSLEKVTG